MLNTVKCYYENGDIITTDMAAGLTHKEMTDYFLNQYFNIEGDKMIKCIKVEVL